MRKIIRLHRRPSRRPADRTAARLKIVQAANRQAVRSGTSTYRLHSMNNLQLCVAICRNRKLVKPELLTAAGFNVHGPNHRAPKRKR